MAATVHILIGPSGPELTARLLHPYRVRARQHVGGALWLAPRVRAAEAIRRRVCQSSSGHRAVLSPQVTTLADLAAELVRRHEPALRPLTTAGQRLYVAEVVARLVEGGELGHFAPIADLPGLAESAQGFCDELRRLGITPAQFREACETTEASRPAGRLDKLRQCATLFDRYLRRLGSERLLDDDAVCERASALIAGGRTYPFDRVRSVFIDGFVRFSPSQRGLIEAFGNWVDELWISLPGEEVEGRAELFAPAQDALDWCRSLGDSSRVVGATEAAGDAPAGLTHLTRALFRTEAIPAAAEDAGGVELIEAPGVLGEARLVARRITAMLRQGVPAEAILVSARDLGPSLNLLGEVFDEYRIPVDLEGAGRLLANPAVTTLLRSARLPDEGWPFAGVTALLRSNYFDPEWRECAGDPEVVRRAEGLLRLLGEPRGREAYLKAVEVWSDSPPPGLEDERADEPRRLGKARLARACRPFLTRFFQAWDGMPTSASPGEFVAALRRFAADIGLIRTAREVTDDIQAVERLWAELDHWVGRQEGRSARSGALTRGQFLRLVATLASAPLLARSPRGPGRVHIVSAERACVLDADYLFLMGLGEGSFPDLASPASLLDDGDRAEFQQAGLAFPSSADRLADEMLLFYRLVTLPRLGLVLSYPAVDQRGQQLLPSSFLRAVTELFVPGAIPVQRQRMLVEGLQTQTPLCPAELRVRWATHHRECPARPAPALEAGLEGTLLEHLRGAAAVADARFRSTEFGPYDGWMTSPAVREALGGRVGPERVFSPTALEAYVACPFRFFLRNVLRIEPLNEPGEEVEHTRRGAAVHRALSRFHAGLRDRQDELVGRVLATDATTSELLVEIDRAVGEYAARAPSPASKELWRLEGERLKRFARKYPGHWDAFVEPWRKQGATPTPSHLECDFGLPAAEGEETQPALTITVDGVEVRVGGRIDRVDVARVADGIGFWVIDYKTGRAEHYGGAELLRFEKLQLPLYALAVERVFFPGGTARPLGMAYWMVTHTGPKPVLPGGGKNAIKWLASREQWDRFRGQLEQWVTTLVGRIRKGMFPLAPRSEQCTATCSFGEVCRITQSRSTGKVWDLALPGSGGGGDEPD